MDNDSEFMQIAINEAKNGYERDDFPVGAVLVINGQLIGVSSNSNKTNLDWMSHAEASLLKKYSKEIKKYKKEGASIELYTTLEPCLMCLGTSFFSRVNRIVFACSDPNGGAAGLKAEHLSKGYTKRWPLIEKNSKYSEESYNLLVDYMKKHDSWKEVLLSFEDNKNSSS